MSSSGTAPRFDLALNPPYQINYRAKRAGKRISASKRRVTFQFGFSDARAIAAGGAEGECRGEEHDVVLVWSHASGKRRLFMDGREIHASTGGRGNARFDYSWQISGCHIMKITANGAPPAGEKKSRERQFDLELDGMSFFDFAKIYELGRAGDGAIRSDSPTTVAYSSYYYESCDDDVEEEEETPSDLLGSQTSVDLLDTKLQVASPTSPCCSVPSLLGASSWSSSSTTAYDEFAPAEQGSGKTFDSISSEIMRAYGSDNPAPAPGESAPSTSRALVLADDENADAIAKVSKSIVNLDDITAGPVRPLSKSSNESDPSKGRAVPSWALVGRAPTLAEVSASQAAAQSAGPAKEVMRTHPAMHPPQQQYQYRTQAPVSYQGAAFGSAAAPSRGHCPAHDPGMTYARGY